MCLDSVEKVPILMKKKTHTHASTLNDKRSSDKFDKKRSKQFDGPDKFIETDTFNYQH